MKPLPTLHPEDRRETLASFATLCGMMSAHTMLETARDALFLSKLPPSRLPWAYLAMALLAFLATRLNERLLREVDKRRLLGGTLLFAAVGTGLFHAFLRPDLLASYYAFYVWTGVLATVAVVQLWTLLGDMFTVAQAKRVYGFIASGGLIGALLGSGLARALLSSMKPKGLLLVAAGLFALSAAVMFIGAREASGEKASLSRAKATPESEDEPPGVTLYLRRLLRLVLIGTVTVTLVDYVFKTTVAATVPSSELGQYFASAYFAFNALSLIVQLLASSWALRVLGVNRALLLLPGLLFLGTLSAPLVPAVLAATLSKASDAGLRNSVYKTATEVLYFPLPSAVRARFKGLIDGVGQRGAQAMASVSILVLEHFGASTAHMFGLISLLSLGWAAGVIGVKSGYLSLFRWTLGQSVYEPSETMPELDLHSLESLVSALSSEHDAEVLAALDVLDQLGKANLVPALLLYHPASAVVLRTLALLTDSGRRDFAAIARRLLVLGEEEIRAAALRALLVVAPTPKLIEDARSDASAQVRATAAVGVVSLGLDGAGEAEAEIARWAEQGPLQLQRSLLEAIGQQRDPRLAGLVRTMAKRGEPRLGPALARVLTLMPDPALLPTLIALLEDRPSRQLAQDALLAAGPEAFTQLTAALSSPRTARGVRRHIPKTIRRFTTVEAAQALAQALGTETDPIVFHSTLRSLGRLHTDMPELAIDKRLAMAVLRRCLRRATHLLALQLVTAQRLSTEAGRLLDLVLVQEHEREVEHVFRLLALLRTREDFHVLHDAATGPSAELRASSRELIEHLAPRDVRDAVLALVDELPVAQRYRASAAALGLSAALPSYNEALTELAADPSEPIRFTAEACQQDVAQGASVSEAARVSIPATSPALSFDRLTPKPA